jgi:hypothetical protein
MNIDRPNIDRAMVSLFFEIKRNMPFEARDDMKISSPIIGRELIAIYHASNDKSLKRLIEDFMRRAGGSWLATLNKPQKSSLQQTRESIITRINLA